MPAEAPAVTVRPVSPADRPVLERLWLMFRHDMAEFHAVPQHALPAADGTYRSERLAAALAGDPDWAAYLLEHVPFPGPDEQARPVGFAFVRALTGPAAVMNSFFVVRGMRRFGHGLRLAQDVIRRHPGRWEVPFQDSNAGAVRFWRQVATAAAGDAWHEERRPVPGRPELPPDVWITFAAPAGPPAPAGR